MGNLKERFKKLNVCQRMLLVLLALCMLFKNEQKENRNSYCNSSCIWIVVHTMQPNDS